jgi:hypothetical protein
MGNGDAGFRCRAVGKMNFDVAVWRQRLEDMGGNIDPSHNNGVPRAHRECAACLWRHGDGGC